MNQERQRLQGLLLVSVEKPVLNQREGDGERSEVSSTTSEAARAKIEALKRAVADAEAFLKTEEAAGTDHLLLKKLEILEQTLSGMVEKTESLQARMALAPAKQEELNGWMAQGSSSVIRFRSFNHHKDIVSPLGQS